MRVRAYRLVPVAAATWIVAASGLVWSASALPTAVVCWAAAAAATLLAVLGRRSRAHASVVVAALSCALAAAAASHVAAAEPGRRAIEDLDAFGGRSIAITATVTGKIEPRGSDMHVFDAVITHIEAGDRAFDLSTDAVVVMQGTASAPKPAGLDVGAVVQVEGTVRPVRGVSRAVLEAATSTTEVDVVERPTGLAAAMSALRRDLTARAAMLPGAGAELIPGLAVGDTSGVGIELDAAMKASSLSHLTAVSGANCALVVGIAFALLSAAGAPRWGRVAGGGVSLVGFVLLVTPEPSVARAAAMASIAMLAVLLGRRTAGMSVLSVATAALLVLDPWLATSLGFGLSVAATAALLVLARPLGHGLERALPRALAWLLAVPLAAQLVCGPLIVLIDPAVPVYGVVANLLAAPAAPAATVLGLLACLAGPVPALADGLVALAWLPASWVAATAETFAALPGSSLPWAEGAAGAFALAAAGAVLVAALVPFGTSPGALALRAASVAVVAALAGALTGSGLLTASGVGTRLPDPWAIVMCDVGQGDAILLRSAGAIALVDAGEDPVRLESCLDAAGVERIDLLVLTHFDVDHAGAAPALAGRVGLVLHGPLADGAAATIAALTASGARVVEAASGMTGMLGAARWRVLWPRTGSHAFAPGNDASIVLDIAGGDLPSILLLGDLSAAPQAALARMGTLAGGYAVVKVAHHGSADQEPRLYERIAASVGLLSVGAGNPYGHPRAEVLDLLGATGASVYRTDTVGAVAVWAEDGSVRVWCERCAVGGSR